jgi:hypothetical protein
VAEATPDLLWAAGHAVLRAGNGTGQFQARLQFMGNFGHFHLDKLSLLVYALGREPLSDIGYTHTAMRPYVASTLAHNTVMIDLQSQQRESRSSMGGRVEFFGAAPTVQVVAVSAPTAYAQASLYRRTLVLVELPAGGAYLVDRFEVEGGGCHDWLLHGDASHAGAVETSLALGPRGGSLLPAGEQFQPWADQFAGSGQAVHRNALGLVRLCGAATSYQNWSAVFRTLPDRDAAVRTTMLGAPGTEVLVGEIPSVRRAQEVDAKTLDYWMPLVICRRSLRADPGTSGETMRSQETAGLRSTFLAVHEPFRGEPQLHDIRGEKGALVIEAGGYRDVHLFGSAEGRYAFEGRYGFLRIQGEKVLAAYLADGTRLAFGDCRLSLPAASEGRVLKAEGKSLLVSGKISSQNADRAYLGLPDGECYAVPLVSAEIVGGDTRLTLGCDPGFEMTSESAGSFTAFPNKEIAGAVTCRLARAALLRPPGTATRPPLAPSRADNQP